MSSIDALTESLSPHAADMVTVARSSIRHGLSSGEPRAVSPDDYAEGLRATMATFVTLRLDSDLRGCIGSFRPSRTLVEDLSHNAFMAAFRDPRFDPLTAAEFDAMRLEISVLGPAAPLAFRDESELMSMLEPGRDGLILEDDGRHGLFLPQVWESLPEPADFLRALKEKAGLPPGPLAATVQAQRFSVARFEDGLAG